MLTGKRELTDEQRRTLGSLQLEFSFEKSLLRQGESNSFGSAMTDWEVGIAFLGEEDDDDRLVHIGRMHILRCNYYEGLRLIEELDEVGEHLEYSELLNLDHGLRSEVQDEFEVIGSELLIINRIELDEEWRGYGLGTLCVGLALQGMGLRDGLAVVWPAPPGVFDEPARSEAIKKLETAYAPLGFRRFADTRPWCVNLSHTCIDDGVKQVRQEVRIR